MGGLLGTIVALAFMGISLYFTTVFFGAHAAFIALLPVFIVAVILYWTVSSLWGIGFFALIFFGAVGWWLMNFADSMHKHW